MGGAQAAARWPFDSGPGGNLPFLGRMVLKQRRQGRRHKRGNFLRLQNSIFFSLEGVYNLIGTCAKVTTSGRRPYTTIDTPLYGEGARRLSPPAGLPEAERRVFLDLIGAAPPSQFMASDTPLVVRYCELVVLAGRAAEGLRNAPLVSDDGKPSPWVGIHASATKGLILLALKLRLSPQARSRKAPKALAATMSYYERMDLEAADDDDETQPS